MTDNRIRQPHFPRISGYAKSMTGQFRMGQIHSVFTGGMNIEFRDRLLYLTSASESLTGFGLCLTKEVTGELLAVSRPGDIAVIQKEKLIIYTKAGIFCVDLGLLPEADLKLGHSCLAQKDIGSSVLFRQLQRIPFREKSGLDRNRQSIRHLADLSEGNTPRLEAAAAYMLGRGPGVTPSGDDILCGYTLARMWYKREDDWVPVSDALNWDKTTKISAAYYKALRSGYVSEDWINLCRQDAKTTVSALETSIARILCIGHTSGADTLMGFVMGINSIL